MNLQEQVIKALLNPGAYDDNPGHIEMLQTHISFVFLTTNFVYKIKKPVNFGFLDFTSIEKRRYYCEKELVLNRRLCGDMYIEVAPINKGESIKIKGEGHTVEYALKMKRMPKEKIMTKLLEQNRINEKIIDQIAKIISDFHRNAETNNEISKVGSLSTVRINWEENFEQTKNVIGTTISSQDFEHIQNRVTKFLTNSTSLFDKRTFEGKIKDCHGDIHSGNIFITDRIYIFDAIEFNERFRFSDITADMAFLAMDLDFKSRKDLSDYFVKRYIDYSEDNDSLDLLPFYKCYRAYVRGKVAGFKLNDPNICDKEKKEAVEEARAYFNLAVQYANELR